MNDRSEYMSFWDHIEEFRWAMLRSLLVIVLLTIGALIVMPYIYDSFILGPTRSDFFTYSWICKLAQNVSFIPDFCNDDLRVQVININLTSQFLHHMTTSLWLAVLLAFPYLVYEVWRFIYPALYKNEKKNIIKVLLFSTIMFFLGCALGYILVFPITFRFLATYELSDLIVNQISLDSYMDNFILLIFLMGAMFELPLLFWLLSKIGFLKRSFFSKYRRHTIIIVLICAAIITPSGDPFTLMVVFFPLYFLFELSRFMVARE